MLMMVTLMNAIALQKIGVPDNNFVFNFNFIHASAWPDGVLDSREFQRRHDGTLVAEPKWRRSIVIIISIVIIVVVIITITMRAHEPARLCGRGRGKPARAARAGQAGPRGRSPHAGGLA